MACGPQGRKAVRCRLFRLPVRFRPLGRDVLLDRNCCESSTNSVRNCAARFSKLRRVFRLLLTRLARSVAPVAFRLAGSLVAYDPSDPIIFRLFPRLDLGFGRSFGRILTFSSFGRGTFPLGELGPLTLGTAFVPGSRQSDTLRLAGEPCWFRGIPGSEMSLEKRLLCFRRGITTIGKIAIPDFFQSSFLR